MFSDGGLGEERCTVAMSSLYLKINIQLPVCLPQHKVQIESCHREI